MRATSSEFDRVVTWEYTDDEGKIWIGIDQPDSNVMIRHYLYCDKAINIHSRYLSHTGWFCDEFQDHIFRGVVVLLHGKRSAVGYFDNCAECICIAADSIQPVKRGELWDDIASDRAYEADDTAKYPAEREREHQELQTKLYNLAQEWRDNEDQREVIGELFECRHHSKSVAAIFSQKMASFKSTRVTITEQAEELDETVESILANF